MTGRPRRYTEQVRWARRVVVLWSLACVACAAARQRRAEEHLRNELSFFVPYVDIDEESKATRRVLGQRNLVVEEEVRGESFSALSAASLDQKRSAVRIITQRGVMAAEDGDVDDWLAPLAKVRLVTVAARSSIPETLVGITKTARGQDAGCLTLFRVLGDGRLVEVRMRVDRFGSLACVTDLAASAPGAFQARVVWPGLSAGVAPALDVELRVVPAQLGAADSETLVLRVADDADWIEAAAEELGSSPTSQLDFAQRQARAVGRAALALARNEGMAQQVGAYRSALGGAMPGSPEAELMAATVAHIERGWSDAEPESAQPAESTAETPPTPDSEPVPEADALIIEPEPPPQE